MCTLQLMSRLLAAAYECWPDGLTGMTMTAHLQSDTHTLRSSGRTGCEQVVKADLMATAVRDRALQGRHSTIDADAPVNGVADPASDMWAAGAIAWHVFTGAALLRLQPRLQWGQSRGACKMARSTSRAAAGLQRQAGTAPRRL